MKEKLMFAVSITLSMIAAFLLVLMLSFIKQQNVWFLNNTNHQLLLYFPVFSIYIIMDYMSRNIILDISQNKIVSTKMDLLNKILNAHGGIIDEIGHNELYQTLSSDSHKLSLAYKQLSLMIVNITTFLFGVIFIFLISGSTIFNMMLVLFIVFTYIGYLLPRKSIEKLHEKSRKEDIELNQYFYDILNGLGDYFSTKITKNRLSTTLKKLIQNNFLLKLRVYKLYQRCLVFATSSAYIVIGLSLTTKISLAHKVFILTAFLYIQFRFIAALTSIPELINARFSAKKINTNLNLLTNKLSNSNWAEFKADSKNISIFEFHNVRYLYSDNFLDFNLYVNFLRLESGKIYFVTGQNGSGKTTLLKLLVGLYQSKSGKIFLNGEIIDPNSEYTQLFAGVMDNSYLSTKIPYFEGIDDLSEVNSLLKELELSEKVSVHANSFSTNKLSRGQLKRLALVVAHSLNRPYMVFDEWASEQDARFREWFYKNYLPRMKARNKLLFVITHDDRYFDYADFLIHIERGCLTVR